MPTTRVTGADVVLVINSTSYAVKGSCDINVAPNSVDSTASGDNIDQTQFIRCKGMISASVVSTDRALFALIGSAVSVGVMDGATTVASTVSGKVTSANHSNPHDALAPFAVEVQLLEIPSQFTALAAL